MNRSVLVPVCVGFILFSFFSASIMAESVRKEQNRVDTVFLNVKIYTMNE